MIGWVTSDLCWSPERTTPRPLRTGRRARLHQPLVADRVLLDPQSEQPQDGGQLDRAIPIGRFNGAFAL